MVGFKATREFKRFLQDMAKRENRSLSNFIVNALLTYIKERHDLDYSEENQE